MKNFGYVGGVTKKDGKYYMYFPMKDRNEIFHHGVAIADNPAGPFIPQPEPIPGSYSIDNCVFKDEDGNYYMYFGGLWGGQLQSYRDNKPVEDPAVNNTPDSPNLPHGDEPSLPSRMVKLSDDMLHFARLQQLARYDKGRDTRDAGVRDDYGAACSVVAACYSLGRCIYIGSLSDILAILGQEVDISLGGREYQLHILAFKRHSRASKDVIQLLDNQRLEA